LLNLLKQLKVISLANTSSIPILDYKDAPNFFGLLATTMFN